ncbi:invasion associated locus B family protein [Phreatobacter sp.]|uniref:invasion associated locus B family protein n=1 Tax=Phreatobacter sp. TaxID=1966341 RepID=UPI003F70A9F3
MKSSVAMRFPKILTVLALTAFALPMAAEAQQRQQGAGAQQGAAVAQFGDWGVFTSTTARGKVCYAASQPKTRAPGNLQRDPAFFFLTSRPGENVRNEVSLTLGFPLRGDATVIVGTTNFAMYTQANGAWIKNAAEEGRLVQAMRAGSQLTVRSTSQRGNVTTDTYSLTGISQALDRVAQECR